MIARKVPTIVRPSRARDYRNHFLTYVLQYLGETPLKDLSLAHLEERRARLQIDRGLSLKTVRNVIDSSLRAMVRDARKAGIEAGSPFADLEYPRRVVPGPDPFSEEERDRLLEFVLHKRWRLGRNLGSYRERIHFPYYGFSSRSSTQDSVPLKLLLFASVHSTSPLGLSLSSAH